MFLLLLLLGKPADAAAGLTKSGKAKNTDALPGFTHHCRSHLRFHAVADFVLKVELQEQLVVLCPRVGEEVVRDCRRQGRAMTTPWRAGRGRVHGRAHFNFRDNEKFGKSIYRYRYPVLSKTRVSVIYSYVTCTGTQSTRVYIAVCSMQRLSQQRTSRAAPSSEGLGWGRHRDSVRTSDRHARARLCSAAGR